MNVNNFSVLTLHRMKQNIYSIVPMSQMNTHFFSQNIQTNKIYASISNHKKIFEILSRNKIEKFNHNHQSMQKI